jgi:hypothetical protein
MLTVGLLAIAISACGSSAAGPTGSYRTIIRGAREQMTEGLWTVTFGKHGSWTLTGSLNRFIPAGPGSYYRGTTFVVYPMSPGVCESGPSAGTYKLKLNGDKLTFVRIKDPCKARRNVLSRTFTKVR